MSRDGARAPRKHLRELADGPVRRRGALPAGGTTPARMRGRPRVSWRSNHGGALTLSALMIASYQRDQANRDGEAHRRALRRGPSGRRVTSKSEPLFRSADDRLRPHGRPLEQELEGLGPVQTYFVGLDAIGAEVPPPPSVTALARFRENFGVVLRTRSYLLGVRKPRHGFDGLGIATTWREASPTARAGRGPPDPSSSTPSISRANGLQDLHRVPRQRRAHVGLDAAHPQHPTRAAGRKRLQDEVRAAWRDTRAPSASGDRLH